MFTPSSVDLNKYTITAVPEAVEKMLYQLSLSGIKYQSFYRLKKSDEKREFWTITGHKYYINVEITYKVATDGIDPRIAYYMVQYSACTMLDCCLNQGSEAIAIWLKKYAVDPVQMSLELN